jgi:ferrous-iron efflux pump FieF
MEQRQRLVRASTWASVLVASLLISMKLYAWFLTGSVSLLASLVDSVMDLIASAISFVAVRFALLPPDDNHRFGHGKAEPLAALAQAAFVAGSSMMLALHSIDSLFNPVIKVKTPEIGVIVTIISLILTFFLVSFQKWVIRRVSSDSVTADALHYQGDLLLNGGVLIALICAQWSWFWVDSATGLAISVFLWRGVYGIGKQALSSLMDEEVGSELEHCIRQAAATIEECQGVHEIRTRRSGPQLFAQLHMDFDSALTLKQAHHAGQRLVTTVKESYPNIHITVHHDPV